MEKLLKESSEIIKHTARELKNNYVPKNRATSVNELFGQFKAPNDFSSKTIKTELLKIAPDIKWSYAEFDIARQTSGNIKGLYWICDAIDGGIHFLQGYYPWCITLTLMDKDQALMTIIYDAERDELYTALKGKGAFLNGHPIHVSTKKYLSEAIVCTAHPNNLREEMELVSKTLESMEIMMPQVFALRLMGPSSLQLAYVAAGKIDAFWEYGNDIYDWLSGALLIEEAGGTAVINSSGLIAANAPLFSTLNQLL